MKKVAGMLLILITVILLIPLLIMEGVGPGLKANGTNSSGVINYHFDTDTPKEDLKENNKTEIMIKVYVTGKKEISEMDIEEYLKGVLSGEMPASFGIEALKAQAVAARTYAVAHMKSFGGSGCKSYPEADVCTDYKCCQAWMSKEDRFGGWESSKASGYWDKISQAVDETEGMILIYDSVPVLSPLYFSTSSGKTENSQDVFGSTIPYLKSVASPDEEEAPKFSSRVTFTKDEFIKKFADSQYKIKLDKSNLASQVKVLSRTEGGSTKSIKVGNMTLNGTDVRWILGLNSANFDIAFSNTAVTISVHGYGHGVGMSQYGANAMAQAGEKYDQILKHYYQGVEIEKIGDIYK